MWPFVNLQSVLDYRNTSDDLDQLRESLVRYSGLLSRDGHDVKPYIDESLPCFQKLSSKNEKSLVRS